MPKKIQDITKRAESPQNQEAEIQPEFVEMPGQVEIEKPIEAPMMPEIMPQKPVEKTEKEEAPIGAAPQTAAPQAPAINPTLQKIENILQEDLEDFYFQLPPEKQREFREVGEETATKIEQLLSGVKVHVKKILELIIKWLKIIPGINRFFLEKEAKIKTDKILKLKEEGKKSSAGQNQI